LRSNGRLVRDLVDGLDQWLYLIRHSENLDPRSPPSQFTVPEVRYTLEDLDIMSHTNPERLQYESRVRAVRDEISLRNWSLRQRDEGLEEGRQEGRQEERELARRKMKIVSQILCREIELGRPISAGDQLIDLPEEQLQRLLNDLATTPK
jgi:hypothetical protein